MGNKNEKFGWWFRRVDWLSRINIAWQILIWIGFALGILLIIYMLCWHSDEISLFDLFVQSINPSSIVAETPLDFSQQLTSGLLFIIMTLFVTGLMISSLVNWWDRRNDKWMRGDIDYNIKSNFVLIIGGHSMVANLCKQIHERDAKKRIVIQTRRPAISLRKEIESKIKSSSKIYIYNGDRCSESDLDKLNAELAEEIYLIGENKELDGYDHDTCNLQCFRYLSEITKQAQAKIPCHVMFSYQSSFHVFQYTDVSNGSKGLEFIPFNIFRVTSQQVLVNNEMGDQKYIPLDGNEGIKPDSEKYVHFIIIGMSRMGSAMAVEAAHLCHFPNFITQESHPRTLITFIDRKGHREMNYFKGRYSNMFQLVRSRYLKLEDFNHNNTPSSKLYDRQRTTFADPLLDKTSKFADSDLGENFIDIDWEFVDGDIANPLVQQYLVEAANDENAITTIALCLPITIEAISASLYMPEEVYRSDNVSQILVEQTTNNSIIRALQEKIDGGDRLFTKLRPFGVFSECDYIKLASNKLPHIVKYIYDHIGDDYKNVLSHLCFDRNGCCNETEDAWNSISSGNGKSIIAQRISNYCLAEMIRVNQRSFGLKSEDDILSDEKLIDLIANVEHNRWNIEQLLIGYRPLLTTDADLLKKMGVEYKDPKSDKKNKKKLLRAHPDLKAYDKLEKCSSIYDKQFAAHLPVLLKIMERMK
jgi:hypothetical protein